MSFTPVVGSGNATRIPRFGWPPASVVEGVTGKLETWTAAWARGARRPRHRARQPDGSSAAARDLARSGPARAARQLARRLPLARRAPPHGAPATRLAPRRLARAADSKGFSGLPAR